MDKNVIQISGGITINVDVTVKNVLYIWNSAICSCENGKYLASIADATYSCENGTYLTSIMDDSAIMCDEIKESYGEETKTIPTNFNEKKATCEMHFCFSMFVLIIIALLITVSI